MTKRFSKPMTPSEIAAVRDEDIDRSDIPELDESFWSAARVRFPDRPKQQLTLRVDAEVLEWFKAQGRGYQTRMNAVLRSFVEAQQSRPRR